MTPANDTAEPCTRSAALDAGERYAARHPGDALVLRHTGADGQRWQLVSHHPEHGLAVARFKRDRDTLVRGGLAIWNHGIVTRFELGELAEGAVRRSGTD